MKAIRRKVIADFGARNFDQVRREGKWKTFRKGANGQVLNVGLGGVFRAVKKRLLEVRAIPALR